LDAVSKEVESLMAIRQRALEGVVSVYEKRLAEIDEDLKKTEAEVEELEGRKYDLETALSLARKHLQEAENLPSRARGISVEQFGQDQPISVREEGELGVDLAEGEELSHPRADGSGKAGPDIIEEYPSLSPESAAMAEGDVERVEEEEVEIKDQGKAVSEDKPSTLGSSEKPTSTLEEMGISKPAKPSTRSRDRLSTTPSSKPDAAPDRQPPSVSRTSSDRGTVDGLSKLSNKVASTVKKNLILGEATINRLIPRGKSKRGKK
jgi:hypothetical protein